MHYRYLILDMASQLRGERIDRVDLALHLQEGAEDGNEWEFVTAVHVPASGTRGEAFLHYFRAPTDTDASPGVG